MTDFVVTPVPRPTLRVQGSDARFPVRRVYCVGQNYAAHAVEMGNDPDKAPPFFFQKNPDNLVADATSFEYPGQTEEVHHEVELMVALGKGGSDIPVEDAERHIFGYGVALDMTRRDLQAGFKKAGRPWEMAKAFEGSAPAGCIVSVEEVGLLNTGTITLDINGTTRQSGDLDQMIWKTAEIIAILSTFVTLAPGDVILSGTPSGVGPVQRGDRLIGRIDGLPDLEVTVR